MCACPCIVACVLNRKCSIIQKIFQIGFLLFLNGFNSHENMHLNSVFFKNILTFADQFGIFEVIILIFAD